MAAETPPSLLEIDEQLVKLLCRRIQVCQEAGTGATPVAGVPVPSLEQALSKVAQASKLKPEDVRLWLLHAQSLCQRASEQQTAIAYLGPIYSYSYLAAVKHFGLGAELVPVATIEAAFLEVHRGQAAYAVVPIENSTDGRVVDTLGMFAKTPAQICGEVQLPIHHCLLGGCSRAEITEVHSKPQAISQCRSWLAEHLPQAKVVEAASTAIAAATAAKQPTVAAIASAEAGVHHGLHVIDENIEDNPQNVTRFAVIGNAKLAATGQDKTSLMFQLAHEPGALAKAMTVFEDAHVNLTWIESFPLPNHPNEYLFFLELDGHLSSNNVDQALVGLRRVTRRLEILGSYPRGSSA